MWINFESAIRGNLTSAKSVKINPKKKRKNNNNKNNKKNNLARQNFSCAY